MSTHRVDQQRDQIIQAKAEGRGATFRTYVKLSGPGWLQSAITLGGGSLAGSLYLGIIGGYDMMWLQPLMMIFGVVMLSAIAHVTLSTAERPFPALNSHVSPVLGWGWIIATMMANLVWAMPQFSLGTAALRQNLGVLTFEGGEYAAAVLLFVAAAAAVWLYDKGGLAYKIFDSLLKLMVGLIVLSFFLVVYNMSASSVGLEWDRILRGFIPNPKLIFEPAESLRALVADSSAPDYWRDAVVSAQRDRMVAAAATAVGINMTFLLPYSMLKRGWDRHFDGLARFDLSTGLFVPFLLATSCVVIAAASQFHANPESGLIAVHQSEGRAATELPPKLIDAYEGNLQAMLNAGGRNDAMADLPEADRILAATLIERDALDLANSLEQLAGPRVSHTIFGIGVVGMAISSIIILMLINGFAVCEMVGHSSEGWLYRFGCLLPGISGAFGALFLWSGKAKFYLAVPTSRFGMVLLPIAYIAFFCLMNNPRLLKESMPRGGTRVMWNLLMGIGVALALTGAAISILNDKARIPRTEIYVRHLAIGLVGALLVAGGVIQLARMNDAKRSAQDRE
ncbi:MAG: hypothetical protein DWQ34_11140 [Planctomycetota bacterium]|nr:MAG: hypothetical protein DWQ34_11140 [Planctomycetota bacterium]